MEISANILPNGTDLQLLILVLRLGILLLKRLEHRLHLLAVGSPDEVLIKLSKYLLYRPLPLVLLVQLGHLDSSVNDLHDELRVIPILPKYYIFLPVVVSFYFQILANFDVICINEIVLLIIDPIHLVDNLPHPWCASRCRRLGIVMGQVAQNTVENLVDFDSQFAL